MKTDMWYAAENIEDTLDRVTPDMPLTPLQEELRDNPDEPCWDVEDRTAEVKVNDKHQARVLSSPECSCLALEGGTK